MNSYGLKRVRDAAEAAETDGRAIKRYSQALACAIAALEAAEAREAELRARVAELERMVPKWRKIDENTPLDVDLLLLLAYFNEWPKPQWAVESGWAGSTKGGWRHGQATHWMPLPAAPKEEV